MNYIDPLKIDNINLNNIIYTKIKNLTNKKIIYIKYNDNLSNNEEPIKNNLKNFVFQTPTLLNIHKPINNNNNYSEIEISLEGKNNKNINIFTFRMLQLLELITPWL